MGVGETGQVGIRGGSVFTGYEGGESVNEGVFRDGWFMTGDMGYVDEEGYLYLQGRIKEQINRGGEKISPFEVDTVLLSHPGVAQAVSFPIPHRTLGESVAALVVLEPREELTELELQSYVGTRLAEFKVPQRILFSESLPQGATGKIKRLGLAEVLALDFSTEYVAPRTELEEQLTQIWAEVLNVPSVGIQDNFFDLGGFSLLGMELFTKLEHFLGGNVPDDAVFLLSTVEKMAEIITNSSLHPVTTNNNNNSNSDFILPQSAVNGLKIAAASSRIPLLAPHSVFLHTNNLGTRPTLFWCFNRPDREMMPLTAALGPSRPIVGFFAGDKIFDYTQQSVLQCAHYFIEQLPTLNPDQPFLLAGHCRGAAVALDMAKILLQTHKIKVHLLLMEYFEPAMFDYPDNYTLIYGKQSSLQAHKSFHYGQIGWRERFSVAPTVKMIDCGRGEFWGGLHLENFVGSIIEFMDDAESKHA